MRAIKGSVQGFVSNKKMCLLGLVVSVAWTGMSSCFSSMLQLNIAVCQRNIRLGPPQICPNVPKGAPPFGPTKHTI